MLIVGFAEFFISSYEKKTVTGQFIGVESAGNGGNSGAYQPGSGLNTVSLTN